MHILECLVSAPLSAPLPENSSRLEMEADDRLPEKKPQKVHRAPFKYKCAELVLYLSISLLCDFKVTFLSIYFLSSKNHLLYLQMCRFMILLIN